MFTPTRTSSRMRRAARIGAGSAAAAAAVLVLAAPYASANVTAVSVSPGASFGFTTPYGTGCSYKVTASVSGTPAAASFSDNGTTSTFNPNFVMSTSGTVETTWTPVTPGPHTITVFQGATSSTVTIPSVKTGINAGSICFVMP